MSDSWNPDLSRRFQPQRARPCHDLVDLEQPLLSINGTRVFDLGCGPVAADNATLCRTETPAVLSDTRWASSPPFLVAALSRRVPLSLPRSVACTVSPTLWSGGAPDRACRPADPTAGGARDTHA